MFSPSYLPAPLAMVLLSAPFASAADVPHIIGSGWQRITWDDPWGPFGSRTAPDTYTFQVYPGQRAQLTLVDGGWDSERIEVSNFGQWVNGWITAGSDSPASTFSSSFDGAMSTGLHDKGSWALQPGQYRLTFKLQRGSLSLVDEVGTKLVHAGFKVDITESPDADEDRLADQFETNTGVYVSPVDTGTDPNKADTDGDGLSDRHEVFVSLTDPNKADTDGDGVWDGTEIAAGKSPLDPTSKPEPIEIRTAVELTVTMEVGKSYQLEWSENLSEWVPLSEILEGNGQTTTRFYSTREYPKARFFRAAVVVPAP